MSSARRCIVACDSSKIGTVGFAQIGALEVATTLVTDDALADADRVRLTEAGLEVVTASTMRERPGGAVVTTEMRRARMATLGYFFLLGVVLSTWDSRLPAIKSSLHLSDSTLGVALFAVPAGSVVTLALSGRAVDRFGAVRVMWISGLALLANLVSLGLPDNVAVLMVVLAVFGAVAGLLDVAMNACGARLEVAYGRPILSSLHAGFSVAGVFGAGLGAIFAWQQLSPLLTFVTAAIPMAFFAFFARRWVVLPTSRHAPRSRVTRRARRCARYR